MALLMHEGHALVVTLAEEIATGKGDNVSAVAEGVTKRKDHAPAKKRKRQKRTGAQPSEALSPARKQELSHVSQEDPEARWKLSVRSAISRHPEFVKTDKRVGGCAVYRLQA
ncbi:hypothetical protein WJX72_008038 [[Myrmecia] bisecta]|uniref:Uncharacterized protein n=1 Tax=[Myrmecia] bisecta TaxID=41462 RepID=A0AAW1PN60_9CHLO